MELPGCLFIDTRAAQSSARLKMDRLLLALAIVRALGAEVSKTEMRFVFADNVRENAPPAEFLHR